ncbi:MAG: hypothetical protein RI554_03050 [Trueperaceae bacterium]|nr:hypothetical protein [Trueperaceae bacterium]
MRTARGPARRARAAACALLCAAAGLVPAVAQGTGDLPLADVAPGLEGYALTEGADGVRRMDVRVVAVQAPDGPGFPLLLVRVGGAFVEAVGGVAAGMSGSPVYLEVDGEARLAGAIGYAFPDTDHRLALVTPIAEMRALSDGAPDDAASASAPARLATPVLVQGASPRAVAHLRPAFARAGLDVMAGTPAGAPGAAPRRLQDDGTGASPRDAAPAPLAPGDAVGVALAHGDLTIAALGTVTDVQGDDLLLLGHPLLRSGPTDLTVVPADVTAIVPSRTLPYKLANLAPTPAARAVRDGAAGLLARASTAPAGIPTSVRVDTPAGATTLRTHVPAHPDLAPAVVAAVVQMAVDGVRDRVAGGSADLAWEIAFEDGDPVRFVEQRRDDADLGTAVAQLAAAPVDLLLDNPFRAPTLARLSLVVTTHPEPRDVEVVEVALERPSAPPGGAVPAFVRLQPWRSDADVRTLSVPLPDDVEPGPLELTIRGASVPDPRRDDRPDAPRDPLRQAISDLPPILSWAELLAALENRPQAREVVVEIPGPDRPRRLARFATDGVATGVRHVTVQVTSPTDAASATDADPTEEATP